MQREITKSFLETQLKRFRAMRMYPKEQEARAELARTLRMNCENPDHMERVATYLLDSQQFCPTPHDIREAAGVVPTSRQLATKRRHCDHCAGSGWLLGHYLVHVEQGTGRLSSQRLTEQQYQEHLKAGHYQIGKMYTTTAVEPCSCREGAKAVAA